MSNENVGMVPVKKQRMLQAYVLFPEPMGKH